MRVYFHRASHKPVYGSFLPRVTFGNSLGPEPSAAQVSAHLSGRAAQWVAAIGLRGLPLPSVSVSKRQERALEAAPKQVAASRAGGRTPRAQVRCLWRRHAPQARLGSPLHALGRFLPSRPSPLCPLPRPPPCSDGQSCAPQRLGAPPSGHTHFCLSWAPARTSPGVHRVSVSDPGSGPRLVEERLGLCMRCLAVRCVGVKGSWATCPLQETNPFLAPSPLALSHPLCDERQIFSHLCIQNSSNLETAQVLPTRKWINKPIYSY